MPSAFTVPTKGARHIELRFAAQNLANKDFLSLSDPFLVCHTVRNGAPAERIGRTETVQDDLNPIWTTTMSFYYNEAEHASSTMLIDVFDRDSADDTSLTKHDFLGRAALRLKDLINAPYGRLDIPLAAARDLLLPSSTSMSLVTDSNDGEWIPRDFSTLSIDAAPSNRPQTHDLRRATSTSRATKKVRGTLTVFAEELNPCTGMDVVFRVSSAMLRDAGPFGRRVTQFFELQRERKEGDRTSWSCVYRSKDGVNVDRNNYVQFDEMSVNESQLHNMDPERRLRLAFYKRHTRQQHELISYITTSLHQIMASRFKETDFAIPMEGVFGDDDGLGHVLIRRVERWDEPAFHMKSGDNSNVTIHMRADHFLHKKFISSLNDSPKHMRKLRQLPSFITMH